MLIESIGFKTNERRLIDEEWAAAAFAQARQVIAAIDETRLADVNGDPDNSYDDIDSYKHDLLNDVAEIELAVVGAHRQAAMVEGGNGIMLLVSGGLSWGDSPGELFESMSRLMESGVFPDARWPNPHRSHNESTHT